MAYSTTLPARKAASLALLGFLLSRLLWADLLPNPSFEAGEGSPEGWSLQGSGDWEAGAGVKGGHAVAVTGVGEGQWRSETVHFEPGSIYELSFQCRYTPDALFTSANAVVGPAFAIKIVPLSADEAKSRWEQHVVRFVVPSPVPDGQSAITLGQWRLKGTIEYDDLSLRRAVLAHRAGDGRVLGAGEAIDGRSYRFVDPMARLRGISRALHHYTDTFHDNRWRFTRDGSEVVYRHTIAGRKQVEATIRPSVWFHEESSWVLHIEVSIDGKTYVRLAKATCGTPAVSVDVPADLLPAETIWVRLRADASDNTKPVFFQVNGYEYRALLDRDCGTVSGETRVLSVLDEDPGVSVTPVISPDSEACFSVRVANGTERPLSIRPQLSMTGPDGTSMLSRADPQVLVPAAGTLVTIPFEACEPGDHTFEFTLGAPLRTRLLSKVTIPILQAAHYGERLPCSAPGLQLWTASAGWKISRTRPAPTKTTQAIFIEAAGNESEAAQLVLRPEQALSNVRISCSDLLGADGLLLPAANVDVLRVRYVNVEYASDALGAVGLWPDPLPPLPPGFGVEGGENQPIWIRVNVPKGTPAGRYNGQITIEADGVKADVPLIVNVFGFSLPDQTTCRSLFGFDWGNIPRYHKLETEHQRRLVLGKYLQSFSDHRISPYNPAPMDPFHYSWDTGTAWEGGQIVDGGDTGEGKCLRVVDDSETGNPTARSVDLIAISGEPLRIRFRYRNATDEPAAIYLCHHDGAKTWFSGKNRHIEIPASFAWQSFEATVDRFPEGTSFIRVLIQGCRYSRPGARTGTVWIDDVSITDTGTGAELIRGGDFDGAASIGEDTELAFDWDAWDAAMGRAVDQYHFNSFRLHVPGLGAGTFHARREGSLLGFAAGTPQHRALFRKWCTMVNDHLTERGLINAAVSYPFDEPAPKDYAFVVGQLKLLKANFPALKRMVPMNLGAADDFVGWINYWCPVLSSHSRQFSQQRQAEGEGYTWYICCSPKAPYIANFIDRPATDLRVWLWQTWQEQVDGILIWQSVYWHSPPAYPDSLQDPYEDSMSWVRGYGTKPGQRRRWNAGDGRFMYPPEEATGTQANPVLDGPVSSIRWEALRDGLEDYEYHAILRRMIASRRERLSEKDLSRLEALLTVPRDISANLTTYTSDPAPIQRRRNELAQAITWLIRK